MLKESKTGEIGAGVEEHVPSIAVAYTPRRAKNSCLRQQKSQCRVVETHCSHCTLPQRFLMASVVPLNVAVDIFAPLHLTEPLASGLSYPSMTAGSPKLRLMNMLIY